MSYNPNFGMPPGMQGQFNFPGAPGTQQPIGPPGMPPPGMQGPGMPPGAMPPGMPGAPMAPPMAPPGTAGAGAQGGLDPNMIKAILALQGQDSQRTSLDRQYALADQLRADAKNQTKGIQGSKVFTAPSWANALAGVGDEFVADRLTKGADITGKGLDTERQTAREDAYSALTGQPTE